MTDINRITCNEGVLGVLALSNDTIEIAASDDIGAALNLGLEGVQKLGTCRLLYGDKDSSVTVCAQAFPFVTLVVAIRTGHKITKSIQRLMRSVAGIPRKQPAAKRVNASPTGTPPTQGDA